MSNTRHAKEGSPLRQERFCSSTEYDRGLTGTVAAMRASLLESEEDRQLLFALQLFSWQPGGLKKVVEEFLSLFASEICTPSMRKFGNKPGQVYTSEQVKIVRTEIDPASEIFILHGEIAMGVWLFLPEIPKALELDDLSGERKQRAIEEHRRAKAESLRHPKSYPAQAFFDHCASQASKDLVELITSLCLDPKTEISEVAPRWCPNLIACLKKYVAHRANQAESKRGDTQVSRAIEEGLDYCLQSGELTVIEGLAGMGKTFSAKTWCAMNPGQARYIQVPETSDDASFMRTIAEALGVACGLSMKGTEIRARVERMARTSKLMLCLDEGHYCINGDYRARRRPTRIAWIMNQLVNYGVPVCLLVTPQFRQDKARVKERTGWNWDQFDRRIGVPIHLPKELSQDELASVARCIFPEGNAAAIKALVGYAIFSKSQLAGIEHIVKRARFEAVRAGREVSLEDIKSAVQRRMPLDAEFIPPAAQTKVKIKSRALEPMQSAGRETTPKLAEGPRLEVGV